MQFNKLIVDPFSIKFIEDPLKLEDFLVMVSEDPETGDSLFDMDVSDIFDMDVSDIFDMDV